MAVDIHVLHRGSFLAIPAAQATQVAHNAWEISIPSDDPVHDKTRRNPTAEAWDDAIFLVDGVETQPAIGSGETRREVRVSVFVV